MKRLPSTSCLLVLIAFVTANEARAQQQAIDPGQQTLRGIEREKAIERLEASEQGQETSTAPATGPVGEAKCFPITTISVSGITLLDPWVVEPITARYAGRCLGEQSISALLAEINKAYADLGYITTRAFLPEQNLASHQLSLKVVEGHVEKIVHRIVTSDGSEAEAPQFKTLTALPTREGEPLNLRDLEQGLDTINRLASSRATVDLAPGAANGGSVVILKEKKADRVHASAGFDNAGSLATGSMRARVSVDADDLVNLNDAWGLSLITSENSNGVTGTISLPAGYTEVSLAGSYFESQNDITASALLFTQTANATAKAQRLVWRDAATKLRVNASLSHFWNERLINTALLTPSQRTSARVGASSEMHWPGSVAQIDVGFSHGVPSLFALDRLQGERRVTPDLGFTKLDASAYWIKGFAWGRVVATAQAQFTTDVLLSPDQLTLGGWDSVRGYQNLETAGDRGFLSRTEVILAVPQLSVGSPLLDGLWDQHRKKFEPFVFVDAGRIWSIPTATSEGMLGSGAGLRFTSERARIEMAAGTPLLDVPGLKDNWQAYGNVSFQLH